MVGRAGKRTILGGSLLLVAAVLLLVALFLNWYGITVSSPSQSETVAFSPDGQTTVSGPGVEVSASYATAHLNSTGGLYAIVEGLVVGGLLTAGIGGALAIATAWRPGLRYGAVILGALGLLFGVLGPVVLLLEQPSALNHDFSATNGYPSFGTGPASGVSNPTNSFFGSLSANGGTVTWGPDLAWYLAFAAGAIALVGAVIALSARPSLDPAPEGAPGVSPWSVPSGPTDVPGPTGSVTVDDPTIPGYVCTTCQIRFTTVSDFQAHVRNVHGMESVNR